MRVNTELVGEKVPEIKVVRLLLWLFARLTIYLKATYFKYIYIYIYIYLYSKPDQIRIHDVLFYSFFYVGLIR